MESALEEEIESFTDEEHEFKQSIPLIPVSIGVRPLAKTSTTPEDYFRPFNRTHD
jgi:hypothetical protein